MKLKFREICEVLKSSGQYIPFCSNKGPFDHGLPTIVVRSLTIVALFFDRTTIVLRSRYDQIDAKSAIQRERVKWLLLKFKKKIGNGRLEAKRSQQRSNMMTFLHFLCCKDFTFQHFSIHGYCVGF